MRLKYHLKSKNLENNLLEGILILESAPQMRTMNFVRQSGQDNFRVPLPYVYHVVRYFERGNRFVFPGVFGSGLRVFGSLNPLKSIEDKVFLLPTDSMALGYVCTNHAWDMLDFDSLEEIVDTTIGFWWSALHSIKEGTEFNFLNWQQSTLNDLAKINFLVPIIHGTRKSASSFIDALRAGASIYNANCVKGGVPSFDTKIPIDATFIDEPWNPKQITIKLPVNKKKKKAKS